MKKLLLAICIFVFIFPGCGKEGKKNEAKGEKDKKEFKVEEPPYDTTLPGREGIENTIKAYNITVINAKLADPYFQLLGKYASNKEAKRIFVESNDDTQRGRVMRSSLRKLVFENISTSDKSGFAETLEAWDFEYIDIKTKEVKEPLQRIRYTLRYSLEKVENRWVVSGIKERSPRVFVSTAKQ